MIDVCRMCSFGVPLYIFGNYIYILHVFSVRDGMLGPGSGQISILLGVCVSSFRFKLPEANGLHSRSGLHRRRRTRAA